MYVDAMPQARKPRPITAMPAAGSQSLRRMRMTSDRQVLTHHESGFAHSHPPSGPDRPDLAPLCVKGPVGPLALVESSDAGVSGVASSLRVREVADPKCRC